MILFDAKRIGPTPAKRLQVSENPQNVGLTKSESMPKKAGLLESGLKFFQMKLSTNAGFVGIGIHQAFKLCRIGKRNSHHPARTIRI